MVRKSILNLLILTASLLLISSCRQNEDISYYYNEANTGAGGGGGCGCGCCGCCNNGNTHTVFTCDSTITITDEKGNPIPGATVTVYEDSPKTFTTGNDGTVDITDLGDGEYIIKVVVPGYADKLDTFTVSDGVCPSVDLTLIHNTCYATFSVAVVNRSCPTPPYPPTGPFPGAVITIDGNVYVTGSDGTIIVPSAPGFTAGTYPYSIAPNDSVDCSLDPSFCLFGDYIVTTDKSGHAVCPPPPDDLSFTLNCK